MRDQLSDTQCAARVTRGRLDPQMLERALAKKPAVADTIERDTACKHEILHPRLAMSRARHTQHDLFAHYLDGAREIHLSLGQIGLWLARRTAEQLVKRLTGHREAREIIEILLVQCERAVLAQIHDVLVDEIHVLRL